VVCNIYFEDLLCNYDYYVLKFSICKNEVDLILKKDNIKMKKLVKNKLKGTHRRITFLQADLRLFEDS